jgi:hypothetical protein
MTAARLHHDVSGQLFYLCINATKLIGLNIPNRSLAGGIKGVPRYSVAALALIAVCFPFTLANADQPVISTFNNAAEWEVIATEGVVAQTSIVESPNGQALRLDYHFQAGGGFCLLRKSISLSLPEHFRFDFSLQGEGPRNNLEFKLFDETGQNVWWRNRRAYTPPIKWQHLKQRRRHFEFAWGPDGAEKPLKQISAIEFAVASYEGGRGYLIFDDLTLETLSAPPAVPPAIQVTSQTGTFDNPSQSATRIENLNWQVNPPITDATLELDLGYEREFGGLILTWADKLHATDYSIQSRTGQEFIEISRPFGSNGGRDYIRTPGAESRYLRLVLKAAPEDQGTVLKSIEVLPPEFSESKNSTFARIAADAPRGWYPRYFHNEQQPWTVTGIPDDDNEVLIDAAGAIELKKAAYRLEPFIYDQGKLISWAQVTSRQSLHHGSLPIPTVTWQADGLDLEITVVVIGVRKNCEAQIYYRLTNKTDQDCDLKFQLALRPFQVLPPWQRLNLTGGAGRLRLVERDPSNAARVLLPEGHELLALPDDFQFGASDFAGGEIVEYFAHGTVPAANKSVDVDELASAGLQYVWSLPANGHQSCLIRIPLHPLPKDTLPRRAIEDRDAYFEQTLEGVRRKWTAATHRVGLELPKSAQPIVDTFYAQQAYILINADGPAIQPGSRTYERSWIRDGSLTSTAMLQTGHPAMVRRFIQWYAPYQYDSGKVPCVVDHRGADPVDEHDSTGQLIHLLMQYYRYTGDREFLASYWPQIEAGVNYLDQLRRQRMTAEYRDGPPEMRRLYGLVPESISHEGYSAKPMHSYWDGFFVLRGLRDAAETAQILQKTDFQVRCEQLFSEYRQATVDSMQLAMKLAKIEHIPGCAELGDFDATSTAIGICPCGELGHIPEPQLYNTFERYWKFFDQRRQNAIEWRDYTPYELRLIGTFVYLNQRERAHELLAFFMKDQQPAGWHQWGEVRWRDPDYPGFVGDMPHTWCGSEFLRSLRTMMVYEEYNQHALILAGGVSSDWVKSGEPIAISDWPTEFGQLSYRITGDETGWQITGKLEGSRPPGGMYLAMPYPEPRAQIKINGQSITVDDQGLVPITETQFEASWQANGS